MRRIYFCIFWFVAE